MTDGEEKQEIIIVRRVMGGGDGHHGGAWKIAFADFMTAMMALFLVLWLVNAANEKTKKSVASYFNPVKLIDRTRSTKGLDEATSSDAPKSSEEEGKSGETKAEEEKSSTEASIRDEDFFKDPFAVLDGIASQELERIENSQLALEQQYASTVPTEDAFLDPFAQAIEKPKVIAPQLSPAEEGNPDSSISTVAEQQLGDKSIDTSESGENLDAIGVASLEGSQKDIGKMETETVETEIRPPQTEASSNPHIEVKISRRPPEEMVPARPEEPKLTADDKLEKMSTEILEEIKERLAAKLGTSEKISESLTVRVTNDGILISITDQFGFSMFQVGSAVPKGEIVLAMSEISNVLAERDGMIRIYGHTDARPYAGDDYDNWRLSTARAHSARLMLARGGLKQSRVSQVVGFADRVLRVREAPESDANRRIEILLEVL